jgi:hypothetical protein
MESFSSLINRDLSTKAQELANLTRILRACLPQNCQQHVSVAGMRDQQLILITDSPVWVSRLRMYTQHMLEMLSQHSHVRVSQIRIKQSPPRMPKKKPEPKKLRRLSDNTSTMIAQTAESIADPELQQALYKLSRNTTGGK